MKILKVILLSISIAGCALTQKNTSPEWSSTQYKLLNAPVLGKLPTGEKLHLGGFSGLIYLGPAKTAGEKSFLTITDRGPTADWGRKFLTPDFNPQLVFLETDSSNNTLKIVKQLPLVGPNGKSLTGFPPKKDLLGMDSECVAVDEAGNYWVGEEYRPAIMSFSKSGRLVRMFVPEGYYTTEQLAAIRRKFGSSAFIRQILPKEYGSRRDNRGFEGCTTMVNKVYVALQSALELKDEPQNIARWIVLDSKTEKLTEIKFPFSNIKDPRIGDLTTSNGNIFVIEQIADVGPKSVHNIYEYTLDGKKTLFLDLVKNGVDMFEKVEGLAVISQDEVAIVSDNDFSLTFGKQVGTDPENVPVVTILKRSSPQGADETK